MLTPADVSHHMDKWRFTVPFVCGATDLGEALRRIRRGAAMIRTKGEAGTGDVVTRRRTCETGRRDPPAQTARDDELFAAAKEQRAPYELGAGSPRTGASRW